MLNSVDLPEPFGPMTPVMEPRATLRLASSNATRPPKCFETRSTTRMSSEAGSAMTQNLLAPRGEPLQVAARDWQPRPGAAGDEVDDPTRHEQHGNQDHDPDEAEIDLRKARPEQFVDDRH